ncbi:hypothetical protein OG874_01115 [Nocardia sp. NBC_00565]|nr:hypothetical protein [Nocardia sp. NBC_00565]WUC03849.1 hypothetical protein OG874_01115 [Nocardia sp. NBC_00565]
MTAAASPVRSVLAHPGIARTNLAAHSKSNIVNRLAMARKITAALDAA